MTTIKAQSRKWRRSEWVILLAPLLVGIALWGMTGGRRLWHQFMPATIRISEATVAEMAFSPDGSTLAVRAYTDKWPGPGSTCMEVWDTQERLLRWRGRAPYWLKGFSPDGKLLAVSHSGVTGIRFWDSTSGQSYQDLPAHTITGWLNSTQLVYLAKSGAQVWDAKTGILKKTVPMARPPQLPEHSLPWWGHASLAPKKRYLVAVTAQHRTVIHGNQNDPFFLRGPVGVWDLQSGKMVAKFGGRPIWRAEFGADDETILVIEGAEDDRSQSDARLSWWNWKQRQKIRALKLGRTSKIHISRGGNYILQTRYLKGDAVQKKVITGTEWKAFDLKSGRHLWSAFGKGADEYQLQISRDGALFCVPEKNLKDKVYECVVRSGKTGKDLARFPDARYLALTPDGRTLACGETDGSAAGKTRHDIVRLHDLSKLKP